MKIAFLADIHSNYSALEACLEYIYSNDYYGIAFLGDFLTDCPYPKKTVSLMKNVPNKYKKWYIKGNREEYLINHHYNQNDDWCRSSKTGSLLYTYDMMDKADINWFEAMPICDEISISVAPKITICHGSPFATRQNFHIHPKELPECMQKENNAFLIGGHGHTHIKRIIDGKIYFMTDAVGSRQNKDLKTTFLSLELIDNKWVDSKVFLDYDIDKIYNDFKTSGLIDYANIWALANRKSLITGLNFPNMCLKYGISMAKENNEPLDEMHFIEAARIYEVL